jgi:hypothetical protein
MKSPSAMPEFRPSNVAPAERNAALCNGIRERILLGLTVFALVHSGETPAGEHASSANPTFDPAVSYFRPSSPFSVAMPISGIYMAPSVDAKPVFSATDFRPRKHTVFDIDPATTTFGDPQLLRTTTVWQRMSEYKSHDRVRVLTLWESSGATVSLQAGRRGDPSLQWTSRLMNHGGSTQGLLDRLFSVSMAGASAGLRNATRSASGPATPKPVSVPVAAGVAAGSK